MELAAEGIEPTPKQQEPVMNPDALIDEFLHDFDVNGNWGTKEVEICQIYEKGPLDKFLKRAFKILGIA